MRQSVLIISSAIIGTMVIFAGIALYWASVGLQLSLHGWIAYGLGCIISMLLSVLLFFLTFKSAREGYDNIDELENPDE